MIEIYTSFNGKLTMGNGKTLCMVTDAYFDYLKGYKIFSNFHIDFMTDYYDISDLNKILKKYKKIVVLTDELSVLSDAYSFNSPNSKELRHFLVQLRKKEIKLKASMQVYNMAPAFMRRLGGNIYVIEKVHSDNSICLIEDNRKCEHTFHKYKITSDKSNKPRYVLPHLFNIDVKNNLIEITKDFFYNCYDSNQVIEIT